MIFKSIRVAGNIDGAFFISEVEVAFGGTTDFTGNNGTALYLVSTGYLKTIATFSTGSRVYFSRNSGYKGGAIVLSRHSALYIHSDCRAGDDYSYFYFFNNTATMFSGAISALTSILEPNIKYFEMSCFLNLLDHQPKNVFFYFHNNSASIGYSDIYTTTLETCNNSCIQASNDSYNILEAKCLGNFTFTDPGKTVATSPKNYTIQFQGIVLPGIETPLKIVQYDEFGDDVSKLFPFIARVQSSRENVKVAYYHNNLIMIIGFPGDEGELLLESST